MEQEINRTVYERHHRKTLAQERIEELEQSIRRKFMIQTYQVNQLRIAEVNDKHRSPDEYSQNMEKLRGNFKLRISAHMPNHKKFEHFAEEPIAFHLHKKRFFVKKVVDSGKKKRRRKDSSNQRSLDIGAQKRDSSSPYRMQPSKQIPQSLQHSFNMSPASFVNSPAKASTAIP